MTEQQIAALWEGFRRRALPKVGMLEDWYVGELDHQTALAEAHKLSGSLGMFDRPDGSVAAAQLEQMLTAHLEDRGADPRDSPDVSQLLQRIRASLA